MIKIKMFVVFYKDLGLKLNLLYFVKSNSICNLRNE